MELNVNFINLYLFVCICGAATVKINRLPETVRRFVRDPCIHMRVRVHIHLLYCCKNYPPMKSKIRRVSFRMCLRHFRI